MRLSRAGFTFILCALAGSALILRGQSLGPTRPLDIQDIGLPAVEQHIPLSVDAHAAGTTESLRRLAAARDTGRVGNSGRVYTPGRVIARFRDEIGMPDRRRVARLASDTADILPPAPNADFDVIRIDPAEDAEAVASDLAGRAEVVYAQAAYREHAALVPNDPLYPPDPARNYPGQWNLKMIDLERAWDIQPLAGSTVTVAVVDTGMAFRNATLTVNIPAFTNMGVRYPALGAQTIPYSAAPQLVGGGAAGRIVAPFDAISNGVNPPLDFDGHGTHVAGTIGQLTNDNVDVAGVAYNVKLMPVKVLGSFWDVLFGSAPFEGGSDDDVARGIRYAADNGAKIINMSLGSSGPANCGTNPRQDGCSPVIEDAMRYAVGKGVFIAVAGGNEFEDVDPQFGRNPTSVIAEIASRIQGAVSVAAVDPTKNRAFYSSTGSYIELAAPGGNSRLGRPGFVFQQTFDFTVTDTFDPTIVPPAQFRAPRFDVMAIIGYTGTSMATPHVSGVAAMVMQQGITTPAAIEAALEKSAIDLGAAGKDDSFGFGLVDARNALFGLGLSK